MLHGSLMLCASKKGTFMEMFGGGGIAKAAAHGSRRAWNLEGLVALDLRTVKPGGEPWDFNKKEDRDLAEQMQDEQRPDVLIGSPPCGPCCQFNWAVSFNRMDEKTTHKIISEGRQHLRRMVNLYWKHLAYGKHFFHEHPQSARSWADKHMQQLLEDDRVGAVVSDQCEYGLVTPGPGGAPMPAKKPTKWASSSPRMLARLDQRFKRQHEHRHLTGRQLKDAQDYPLSLLIEILRGMRDELDHQHPEEEEEKIEIRAAAAMNSTFPPNLPTHKQTYANEAMDNKTAARICYAKFADGTKKLVNFNVKDACVDEYNLENLDLTLTNDAIANEMELFNERVWEFMTT